ncbi:MAG: hypothetical protein KJO31_15635 [Gammaproteobacteria bacterium]|nr:hypothetical protein [Gammaproteobacteria bacterium]
MPIRYLLLWFGLAIVAIVNGVVRQATYGKTMSDLAAHQLSTVTAVLASGAVVGVAAKFWPIRSAAQAWTIGVSWLLMTIAFEFGFGHFVAGHSWSRLLADYNLFAGRVWALFLLWMTVLPYLLFQFYAPR